MGSDGSDPVTNGSTKRSERWQDKGQGVLDDSVANLLTQMGLAMGGMFLAFAAAEAINGRVYGDAGGWGTFVARGITFCVLGSISIFITSARPIRRALLAQRAEIQEHERRLQAEAERHGLSNRLQSAFEMVETDVEAFGVVGEALATIDRGPAEMLLADSSRAHLRRVTRSADGAAGCDVPTPWSCPAVRRSRTLEFTDSDELGACPRLKDRPEGACSAICVPVTVLGTPTGVLHVTGPQHRVVDASVREGLETLAEQAGSRIGVIRAMASSQLQATTDPLTGLLNRRCLEEELARLRDAGTDFSVAFLDLDHFKDLNDTFGHETGDRALRSFARVLRRCVRDGDLVCRYGGEEFVVVLPSTGAEGSSDVLERVVRDLADSVRSGDVPPFTVSVGIAEGSDGSDATDVIRSADEAMFRAKQAGRDRIVLAEPTVGRHA